MYNKGRYRKKIIWNIYLLPARRIRVTNLCSLLGGLIFHILFSSWFIIQTIKYPISHFFLYLLHLSILLSGTDIQYPMLDEIVLPLLFLGSSTFLLWTTKNIQPVIKKWFSFSLSPITEISSRVMCWLLTCSWTLLHSSVFLYTVAREVRFVCWIWVVCGLTATLWDSKHFLPSPAENVHGPKKRLTSCSKFYP